MINSFIKNNFKIILAVSVTAIVCISGTVLATGYFAKDIGYTKEGVSVKNVEEALNDLYSRNNKKLNFVKVGAITGKNQSYTFENDGYIIGTMARETSGSSGWGADLKIDGILVDSVEWNDTKIKTIVLPVAKGSIVTNREDRGTYNLEIYEIK